MTSSVSLSGHLSLTGPRIGERGGKGEDMGGKRFEETLAGAVGNRSTKVGIARDEPREEPRLWLLDGRMGNRIGLQGSEGGQSLPAWDQQFGEASESDLASDELAIDLHATEAETAGDKVDPTETALPVDIKAPAIVTKLGELPTGTVDADAATPPEGSRVTGAAPDASASHSAERSRGAGVDQLHFAATQATEVDRQSASGKSDDFASNGAGETRGTTGRASGASSSAMIGNQGVQTVSEATQEQTQQRPQSDARQPANEGSAARASNQAPSAASDQFAGRVSVLGTNNAVAPATVPAQVLGATSAGLVSEIAAAPGWRSAAQEAALTPGLRPAMQAGVQSLKIQLHPIELGMVTARLTQSGSQMSIEIQVESNDARQRLSTDADQIVKALKSIGIEVDRITIQQAPQASTQAQPGQYAGTRDMGSQSQQQAAAEGGSHGQGERGSSGNQSDGSRHGTGETASDRAGGSLYI